MDSREHRDGFALLDSLLEQYDSIIVRGPRGEGYTKLVAKPLTDPNSTIALQGRGVQDVLEQLAMRRGR